MGLFRRDKQADAVPEEGDQAVGVSSSQAQGAEPVVGSRARGPWDVSEVPDRGKRVDLGPLWLPGREGMELRMEVEKTSRLMTAAAVTLHGSALQLQVFAAPRTEGIWDEIRAEIAESVTKQGGSAEDIVGPFGRELLARMPVRTPEGRTGHRPVRFIGHDGPRWFLRGVLTGRAAADEEAAAELEGVFADVVVVRGSEARAPRDLLPLALPGRQRAEVPPEAAQDVLTRGPEITETR
ncbi:hypothetical protein N866_18220 [Actinotalea ferrariae CF5-4]|uniref:DUF3710 domain-containing protein n=1 Tax=Actinotalea ferrariae CF5-4 TaxID=948458 RepID=A0A021VUP6_9CELL|nr:DUF3710 domain-containing protein [Actinotalea ferrariae]EYR63785.1 hypothetical protein N866_18220 [Actinotalea ferrariae CF5-4]